MTDQFLWFQVQTNKGLRLGLLCWCFKGVQEAIPSEGACTLQIGSVAFPPGQCTSGLSPGQCILVTDYLTKMGIKTVPQPPYSPDLAPCDFLLFPKFRGCRYETIEEMKEAVTKVIDTLTQEDFYQKLLERYNKCIATGGDYFEGDSSFMCVLSIKVPIRKKSRNLFNDPRMFNSHLLFIILVLYPTSFLLFLSSIVFLLLSFHLSLSLSLFRARAPARSLARFALSTLSSLYLSKDRTETNRQTVRTQTPLYKSCTAMWLFIVTITAVESN